MDQVVTRVGLVVLLLIGPLVIGVVLSGQPAGTVNAGPDGQIQPSTVHTLLEDQPEGETVRITGRVTQVLQDHVSQQNHTYQQFYVADDTGEILVFCGTGQGRVHVQQGDAVDVRGTFKVFYGTPEVYTQCRQVRHR